MMMMMTLEHMESLPSLFDMSNKAFFGDECLANRERAQHVRRVCQRAQVAARGSSRAVWLFGMRGAPAMDKFKGKVGKSRATVRVISVASREQPVACPASGLLTSLPPPCTAERPGAGWGVNQGC